MDNSISQLDPEILRRIEEDQEINKPPPDQQNGHHHTDEVPDVFMPPLPEDVAMSLELSENACPLRDIYIQYSKAISPEGFDVFHEAAFWCLLSIIAARRVYADFVDEIYTPLYIIFAARTSLFAKSQTAKPIKKVLRAAGLDWLMGADRTTPQKFLMDLAGKYIPPDYAQMSVEDQERLELRLAMSGQVGWINDEFGKFVKGMLRQSSIMADFADIFLMFDNCEPEYKNSTIQRGGEPIKNPYLAMLGCMTPANVRDNAKTGAEFWSDGFWARFLFISPPQGAGKDAPFERGKVSVPGELSIALANWHQRLGVPVVTIVALLDEKTNKPTGKYEIVTVSPRKETGLRISDTAYEAWKRYRSALKKMIASFDNEDLDGSYDRLPTFALRIATLAASSSGSETIELRHWAVAQEFIEKCRLSLHHLYMQVNATPEKQSFEEKVLETAISLLGKKETISARDVARALHKDSKEILSYLKSLARDEETGLEEIKGRQSSNFKMRESK